MAGTWGDLATWGDLTTWATWGATGDGTTWGDLESWGLLESWFSIGDVVAFMTAHSGEPAPTMLPTDAAVAVMAPVAAVKSSMQLRLGGVSVIGPTSASPSASMVGSGATADEVRMVEVVSVKPTATGAYLTVRHAGPPTVGIPTFASYSTSPTYAGAFLWIRTSDMVLIYDDGT